MGHHRGDDRKTARLFDDPNHNVQELDADDELEAALRRELSELSGCDQCLDPEAGQTEHES